MNKSEKDYGFHSKWSEEIAELGFTQVPNLLIVCQGHLGLSDAELVTFIQLNKFWFHEDSLIYPSIATLADYSGKSYSTLQKRLRSLEKKGFISRDKRQGRTDFYDMWRGVAKLIRHQVGCPYLSQKYSGYSVKVTRRPYAKATNEEYESLRTNDLKELDVQPPSEAECDF